jgi:HEAT repeat protein
VNGKPAGRREAARALAGFNGADANALALGAMSDPDPQVQANVLAHIRQRAIPGILPRLLKFMNSPHLVVRRAAQQSLAEFSFPRFVASFDMLDEDTQRTTGNLVKKIDMETLPLLREELRSTARSRRIRGMQIASVLDYVDRVGDLLLLLLHDEDPDVRRQAGQTIGDCKSSSNRQALAAAQCDNDPEVQEAVRQVLMEQLK